MYMGRDVCDVARKMQACVPGEYKHLFDTCLFDFSFRAPESVYLSWDQLQGVLLSLLPEDNWPVYNWQFQIASIFSTMSIEEIKREIEKSKK
jgi:hypothetical protein